ncbi:unnamed protein product [Ilex paraguariensis]|uniref:Uncharacterized protein n=1 Tax=Ilex paraguariensis TaxID=185542 RepID=A0ABC8U926_9AQUA
MGNSSSQNGGFSSMRTRGMRESIMSMTYFQGLSCSISSGAGFDTHYYLSLLTGRGLCFAHRQLMANRGWHECQFENNRTCIGTRLVIDIQFGRTTSVLSNAMLPFSDVEAHNHLSFCLSEHLECLLLPVEVNLVESNALLRTLELRPPRGLFMIMQLGEGRQVVGLVGWLGVEK